ncbi:MAG: ferredoxin [Desulfatibacillum sp.]|nr:ferredoxin [Desulfatibacillum sp.]
MKVPVVDHSSCVDCDGCIEMCPEVFFKNDSGMIQVRDLKSYTEDGVNEAIKYCPADCITWEDE